VPVRAEVEVADEIRSPIPRTHDDNAQPTVIHGVPFDRVSSILPGAMVRDVMFR